MYELGKWYEKRVSGGMIMDKKIIASELLRVAKDLMSAEKFAPGDKVMLRHDVLKRHSQSVPPHAGFTTEQFSWRKTLDELEGQVGTIERVFPSSKHVNVQFDSGIIGLDSTELVRAGHMASVKMAAYVSAPVWDVLNETWNVLHDIEYDLGDAASRYDIASSYHGEGAVEAKRIMNRINELKAELEKISHHSFTEVTKMEQDFVKKFGTPDEFSDKSRREIFPN